MEVITVVDATVDDETNDVTLPTAYEHSEMIIQVEISGTFTVQVLGKIHASATYIELIAEGTVNVLQPLAYMPYIRVITSGGAATPICSVYALIGDAP